MKKKELINMSTYAISDLHGSYEIWLKIHNTFLKENDKLFILGDCIDRGDGGLAILTEALNDTRCVVLCGNHEDLMINALEEEIQYGYSDYWIYKWFQNGGRITYDEWQEKGRDFSWIGRLKALSLWAEYTNKDGNKILMSHSGIVPKRNWGMDSLGRNSLLWNRDHLTDIRWHRAENEFSLHGHTPIMIMPHFSGKGVNIEPGAFYYCDGHKINIDNGTVWTKQSCVLDLDTFDGHIFEV